MECFKKRVQARQQACHELMQFYIGVPASTATQKRPRNATNQDTSGDSEAT